MISLSTTVETRLIHAAQQSGQNLDSFLARLLDEYTDDFQDIRAAEAALNEPGETPHEELKAKYGL